MGINIDQLIDSHPEIPPFLIKKWARLFTAIFDAKAEGDVEWTDFYRIAKHVRDIYGAQSEQMKYAKETIKALWEGLLGVADQNQDKIISIQEWIDLLSKADSKNEQKWFTDYLEFMFKLFDVSEDGVLDVAEYADGLHAYGFTESEGNKIFNLFARTDKKGMELVDWFQWKELWFEYLQSTDPNARGNNLFGKLDFDS